MKTTRQLKCELRAILSEMGISKSTARKIAPRLEPTMMRFIEDRLNREQQNGERNGLEEGR